VGLRHRDRLLLPRLWAGSFACGRPMALGVEACRLRLVLATAQGLVAKPEARPEAQPESRLT
jgi:hypothetical protein